MPILVPPAVPAGRLSRQPQPTLIADELTVRPWQPSDVPGVVAAYRNPEIQKWHSRTMTDDEALEWVASWPLKWVAETHASWAVAEGDRLVGRIAFHDLDFTDGAGQVAYWVLPNARGRNIAARALIAATGWMFATAGFHRMELFHSTRNDPSCRVADKAGYAYEGTARSQELHVDGWHDMHVHARIADRQ
jgi:[ribosomal protein S5]-alanine N-acetyltransferase